MVGSSREKEKKEMKERGWMGPARSPTAHPGQAEKSSGGEKPPKMHSCPPHQAGAPSFPEPAAPGRLVFDSGKAGPTHQPTGGCQLSQPLYLSGNHS